jgi:2'-5' RNA ligase
VALDLPEDARRRIVSWREEALAERDDLRPVAAEALHVTLVFLGYHPERDVPRIASVGLDTVAKLGSPLLRAMAVRPVPPRRPRLFALDLEDDGGRAGAIQAALEGALAAARLHRPERRPFWPHLTLARVKRGREAVALRAPPPPGDGFRASRVTLYRSVLRPQGARYDALQQVELP